MVIQMKLQLKQHDEKVNTAHSMRYISSQIEYFTLELLILLPAGNANDPSISARIMGGTDAEDDDVPYQCALESFGHYCGCAIINAEWVLTAAHCLTE